VLELSAVSGQGLDEWIAWIDRGISAVQGETPE
jgi:hypothetical protein